MSEKNMPITAVKNTAYVTHRLEIAFWQATIPLLRKQQRTSLPACTGLFARYRLHWLALLGCLSLLGFAWYNMPHSRLNQPVLLAGPVDAPEQQILVVVGDNLTQRDPLLKGIWLAVKPTAQPVWKFMPVFPASLSDVNLSNEWLVQAFRQERNGALDEEFLGLLGQEIAWDRVFVTDEAALAGMIDLLGGMQIGMDRMDGTQAVARLFDPRLSPQIAKLKQAALIRFLCLNSVAIFRDIDPLVVQDRFAEHFYTDQPVKLWTEQWYRMRDYSRGMACEFPTEPDTLSQYRP